MHMHLQRLRPQALVVLLAVTLSSVVLSASAHAKLTIKSPEVKAAVARGIEYLSASGDSDGRFGAYALTGISMMTNGIEPTHPMIEKCAGNIQEGLANHNLSELNKTKWDIYSTGICIMFLIDRDQSFIEHGEREKHRADIQFLMSYLYKMQKPHGGWGYENLKTGDTSMTQYGVLSSWLAWRAGYSVPANSINRVATWLVRTQDPSGAFGYQGKIGENNQLVKQSNIRPSLSAAGLGSVYLCADMFGMGKKNKERDEDLTRSMREVESDDDDKKKKDTPKLKSSIGSQTINATQGRGNQWFTQNFEVDVQQYRYYYFYAFERYMSIREHVEGKEEEDPQWYSDIASHILANQREDGSWNGQCNTIPDTSFAILFLLRSMKKHVGKARDFGESLALAGQGIPRDLANARVNSRGDLVQRRRVGSAQGLIESLDDPELADFDDEAPNLVDLPAEEIADLMEKQGDKVRKLVANKSPKARINVVIMLGKTRDLDNVEVLLYALTDPVPAVALAANESLGRIRRNLDAITLPEKFTEEDRRLAFEKWKDWYLSLRPNAKFEWIDKK